MIRVCCICNKIFGEKPPLENKSETHGFCEKCFPLEMKKLEVEMKKIKKKEVK